ncbi:MAG TPA: hypothetical protein EYP85_00605 [Armatimonadetes bacterium]|nr:hypothetical protein [Armatimonadota bacterium]
MRTSRPASILLICAYQAFLVWVYTFFGYASRLFLAYLLALTHLVCLFGLYYYREWARRTTIRLFLFDVIAVLLAYAEGLLPASAVLVLLGMPAYALTVLTDPRIKGRFS